MAKKKEFKRDEADFFQAIALIAEEKGLSIEQVKEAFKIGLEAGVKRTYNAQGKVTVDVEINDIEKTIIPKVCFLVVEEKTLDNPNFPIEMQVLLSDQLKIDKNVKPGDIIKKTINPEKDFQLYAVRDFKNRFNERLNRFRKEIILNQFQDIKGKLVTAKVTDVDRNGYDLLVNNQVAFMTARDAHKKEFKPGDYIKAIVKGVEEKERWPKLLLTINGEEFIKQIMAHHIPEIKSGEVEIVAVAREEGQRTKVGVRSLVDGVDPIGATMGESSSRINDILRDINFTDELSPKLLSDERRSLERLEVFLWVDNEKDLITNALKPAKIITATGLDYQKREVTVVVEKDDIQVAIGKGALNVKLAGKCINWKISIVTPEEMEEEGRIY